MEPINFIYWLNGFLELSDVKELTSVQLDIIKEHLKLVLTKVTPSEVPGEFRYPFSFLNQNHTC